MSINVINIKRSNNTVDDGVEIFYVHDLNYHSDS